MSSPVSSSPTAPAAVAIGAAGTTATGHAAQLCGPLTLEQKWFRQFFVGILICVCNGACFTFGIFSPFMKRGAFRFSQWEVNVVSTVGVLLSYFSLPNGYLFDTRGPRATLLAGSTLNVCGWAGMFLIFVNMEQPLLGSSVVVMSLFYGLSQFSASFYETGSVLTNLRAFSCYKGRVVLIQKTFMGLGSSLVAQIYVAFFERGADSIAPFFLFLLCLSAVTGLLSSRFVRLPSEGTWCLGLNVPDLATLRKGGGESTMFDRPFNIGTVILVVGVAYVLVVSLIENAVVELSFLGRMCVGFGTIGLVLSFISMVFLTPSYPQNEGGYKENAGDAAERAAILAEWEGGDDDESLPARRHDTASPSSTSDEAQGSRKYGGCLGRVASEATRLADEQQGEESDLPSESGSVHPAEGEHHNSRPRRGCGCRQQSSSHRQSGEGSTLHPGDCATAREDDQPVGEEDGTVYAVDVEGSIDSAGVLSFAIHQTPVSLNNAPLFTNLKHCDIWMLWYVCFASWGAMTLISTNSSQIYQAMAYDSFSLTVNTVFVSIYGVASAVGRILVGAAQPIMERRKISVATFLIVAPVMNLFGLPLFLLMPGGGLFLPFFVVGFATGVSWGSTVLVVTGFFTTHNCGKHYSWLYTAGMLSPIVFNFALFGPVYDYYSSVQGRDADHSCAGAICITAPILVCLVINAIAAPMAYLFTKRTTSRGGVRVE